MKPATTLHIRGASRPISRSDAARSIRNARALGQPAVYSTRSRLVHVAGRWHDWQIHHAGAVSAHGFSTRKVLRAALPGIATVLVTVVFAAQMVYGWSL